MTTPLTITGEVSVQHIVRITIGEDLILEFDAQGAAAAAEIECDPAWQATLRADPLLGLVRIEQRLRHLCVHAAVKPAPGLTPARRREILAAIRARRAELARQGLVARSVPRAGHA